MNRSSAVWWLCFAAVFALRLWLCFALSLAHWTGWLFFGIEALCLALAATNAATAKVKDTSWGAVWMSLGYLGGIAVFYGLSLEWSAGASLVFLVGSLLRLWALASLNVSYSCAGASFVRVVASGPYSLVRHPQAAARLLKVLAFALAGCDLWRVVLGAAFVAGVMVAEERFLMGQAEYREYARLVRWRVAPWLV